jgi:hypothetical protein
VSAVLHIYIFSFKSTLLTKVGRIENARRESMCRVVNKFSRCITDVKSKRFGDREAELLYSRYRRRRGKI